jgi:hypothetical protein
MNGKPILKEKDKPKRERLVPVPELQKLADKKMQELGKKLNPVSILSGKPTQVMHHVFSKSCSSALRYSWKNVVPVTHGEHNLIHNSGNPEYLQQIIRTKGQEWYDELRQHRTDEVRCNREYYLGVMEKLENHYERICGRNTL